MPYRAFRDEGEELALPGVRERDDEQHEDRHLRHEEHEHLIAIFDQSLQHTGWARNGERMNRSVDERRHCCFSSGRVIFRRECSR